MTTVYMPLSSEGFEFCHPVDENDFETLKVQIDGTTRGQTWSPIQMRLIREDEGKSLLESDSPWLGTHALIFRKSAIEKLKSLLMEYGELLPVACPGAELAIFNPTHVVDALDEEASSVLRFSGGRIMRITRYAFRPEVVAGVEIFKIPSLRVSPTFVGERFVKLWHSSGLTGLEFKSIWSSDS